MKMIRAIIRPEAADATIEELSKAGYYSFTKLNVFGRGKQNGLFVGNVHYDEFPKIMIMMVVENESMPEVCQIIKDASYTGNIGDGKIFVTDVEDVYTVSTGEKSL